MKDIAFEFLNQFVDVSEQTEELVLKVIKKRFSHLSPQTLVEIFERGIAGDYGKVYKADPQTILGWIEKHCSRQDNNKSYYESDLLPPHTHITSAYYPQKYEDWMKEANKAYTKYLNGTDVSNFHPHIYDRLMCDGRIQLNQYKDHLVGEDIDKAKQSTLKQYFEQCKKRGHSQIYHVN